MTRCKLPFRTQLGLIFVAAGCFLFLSLSSGSDKNGPIQVGLQSDGRIVVPTNQILTPSGAQVVFPGRPVDMALTEEGRVLVVKNMADLVFIDVASARIKQTLKLPPKKTKEDPDPGFSVVGILVQGDRVYVSD